MCLLACMMKNRPSSDCGRLTYIIYLCGMAELGRKYDVAALDKCCDRLIASVSLTPENLPKWHLLATEQGYVDSLKHCYAFLCEPGNFPKNVHVSSRLAYASNLMHAAAVIMMFTVARCSHALLRGSQLQNKCDSANNEHMLECTYLVALACTVSHEFACEQCAQPADCHTSRMPPQISTPPFPPFLFPTPPPPPPNSACCSCRKYKKRWFDKLPPADAIRCLHMVLQARERPTHKIPTKFFWPALAHNLPG